MAPAFYSLSSEEHPSLFSKVVNGSPERTDTIPQGLINIDLQPNSVYEVYDPVQLQELQYFSQRGTAQNSITAVLTNGILQNMNEPFKPLVPTARGSHPNGIINAASQLFNFSPFKQEEKYSFSDH